MSRFVIIAVSALVLIALGCGSGEQSSAATREIAPTETATTVVQATVTADVLPTATAMLLVTAVPISSPTSQPTRAAQPTPLPTRTPPPRFRPSPTPLLSPTPPPSPTPTPAPTATPTPIPTLTPTPIPYATPTRVPQLPGRNVPIAPFPGDLDWLRVEGNRIVDESGETVVLRGANVENWQWNWDEGQSLSDILAFERAAIPVLTGDAPAGWGANAVHLDVSVKPFIDGNLMYMAAVDELVALAKANGAYTIMSLRYEDILDEPVFPTQVIEDGAAVLAGRYSDEPAVLFVLGSEPRQISWANLKPRLETMLDALRANHPRALAFLPGTEWSRYVFHVLDDPLDRQNFALQVSTFDTWEIVQSGNSGFFKPLRLDEVAAAYPLLIGGFGVSTAEISGSNWMREVEDLQGFSGFMEENGVSWTAWLFNDSGCPCLLQKPWQDFMPTDWGAVLKDLMQATAN